MDRIAQQINFLEKVASTFAYIFGILLILYYSSESILCLVFSIVFCLMTIITGAVVVYIDDYSKGKRSSIFYYIICIAFLIIMSWLFYPVSLVYGIICKLFNYDNVK